MNREFAILGAQSALLNCISKKLYFLVFPAVVFCISCAKEQSSRPILNADGCRDTFFTFQADILPLLNLNCNYDECHHQGGLGSYDFTNYQIVVNRIRAGTFEYRIDLPANDPQHMPEKMLLNKCDYYTLKTWIRQGYPEK